MSRGALLVDWENLVYGLYDGNYYYPVEELARRLRETATRVLRDRYDVNLAYRGVFAPARAFNPVESAALVQARFEVVQTLGGKNAADLALAIKAARLFLEPQSDFSHFIVVTGDVDYLALAWEIENENRVCHLWPVSADHVNRQVRQYQFVEYIPELLELHPQQPKGPDEMRLFLLHCHRVIDEGKFLGGVERVKQELMRLGGLSAQEASQAFTQHQRNLRRVRVRLRPGDDRSMVERYRPSYERPDVQRAYEAADVILDLVARREEQSGAREGELLESIAEAIPNSTERVQFLETLVEAGYLSAADNRYRLPSSLEAYGIVRPLQRIVLILNTLLMERGWDVVSSRFVLEKWERIYKVGGNLNPRERERAHTEAELMLKRADYACVIEQSRSKGYFGYRILKDHPVTQTTEIATASVVKILADRGALQKGVPQDPVIEELTERFSTESTARFWLGALAATGHVPWYERSLHLRRTKLVMSILNA